MTTSPVWGQPPAQRLSGAVSLSRENVPLLRKYRVDPGWRSCRGCEGDPVAEPLQLGHGPTRGSGGLSPVVIVRPRLPVVRRLRQHMVDRPDRPEQAVGDGHDRFLVATVAHHPAVAGPKGA